MSGPDWSRLIPVNVVTGFLGSGKTTLLRRLLVSPRLASTAVLVNEFGEVGLDHHLLEPVAGDMVLLDNGCVCCAVRDDLRGALLDLHGRRERREAPRYDRVVIESSGLADPAPVLHTLTADPVLRHHYRPGAVVTVVDALHGSAQLERHPESVRQAALADRLILTKTDLAERESVRFLEGRLRALNPAASIRRAAPPGGDGEEDERAIGPDPVALLVDDVHRAQSRQAEAERWLGLGPGAEPGELPMAPARAGDCAAEPESGARGRVGIVAGARPEHLRPASSATRTGEPPSGAAPHRHTEDVTSFRIETDEPIDWTVFGIWLGMLLHRHGENILRVKGIVDVPGLDGPVLLNAVQHTVHPPTHLPAWPRTWERDEGGTGPWRGSRIVFIVHGLDRGPVERSLAAFRDALGPAPAH
ncbi:MAG: GTP-binding protein [Immundisolibacterales bacterium]|nr:GTP-binding protein [Immundisolibacterales bacterium]